MRVLVGAYVLRCRIGVRTLSYIGLELACTSAPEFAFYHHEDEHASIHVAATCHLCALCQWLGGRCRMWRQRQVHHWTSGWETTEFTEPEAREQRHAGDRRSRSGPRSGEQRHHARATTTLTPSTLRPMVQPAASGAECEGGRCLTGDQWPDGYCTTDSCDGSCDSPRFGVRGQRPGQLLRRLLLKQLGLPRRIRLSEPTRLTRSRVHPGIWLG